MLTKLAVIDNGLGELESRSLHRDILSQGRPPPAGAPQGAPLETTPVFDRSRRDRAPVATTEDPCVMGRQSTVTVILSVVMSLRHQRPIPRIAAMHAVTIAGSDETRASCEHSERGARKDTPSHMI